MVHILALKAIGICCLLDEEVAKQFMMLFYLQLSSDDDIPQIWIIALKTIFDLLLAYGLETFEIEPYGKSQDVSNVADRTDGNENRNFIKIIITLLDNVVSLIFFLEKTENSFENTSIFVIKKILWDKMVFFL